MAGLFAIFVIKVITTRSASLLLLSLLVFISVGAVTVQIENLESADGLSSYISPLFSPPQLPPSSSYKLLQYVDLKSNRPYLYDSKQLHQSEYTNHCPSSQDSASDACTVKDVQAPLIKGDIDKDDPTKLPSTVKEPPSAMSDDPNGVPKPPTKTERTTPTAVGMKKTPDPKFTRPPLHRSFSTLLSTEDQVRRRSADVLSRSNTTFSPPAPPPCPRGPPL